MHRFLIVNYCQVSYSILSAAVPVMHVVGIVVDQNQALRFALDVARGMEFLHSMEPLIPNLTLNSKHIMVTCQWTLSLSFIEQLTISRDVPLYGGTGCRYGSYR